MPQTPIGPLRVLTVPGLETLQRGIPPVMSYYVRWHSRVGEQNAPLWWGQRQTAKTLKIKNEMREKKIAGGESNPQPFNRRGRHPTATRGSMGNTRQTLPCIYRVACHGHGGTRTPDLLIRSQPL